MNIDTENHLPKNLIKWLCWFFFICPKQTESETMGRWQTRSRNSRYDFKSETKIEDMQ